jgi:hypothetical protein
MVFLVVLCMGIKASVALTVSVLCWLLYEFLR